MTAQILPAHAGNLPLPRRQLDNGSAASASGSQIGGPSHDTPKSTRGSNSMSVAGNMSHQAPQSQSPVTPPGKTDMARGRRRTRDAEGEDDDDQADDAQGGAGGSSRKRRRSRKGLDKKFDCPIETCGKSYSRAEHLYRHQLNHNPKKIYRCDFPDCQRSFVRQDLCARHKERHTSRGSQLLRKDTFGSLNPIVTGAFAARNATRQGPPPPRSGDVSMQSPQSESAGTRPGLSGVIGKDVFQRPQAMGMQRPASFGSTGSGPSAGGQDGYARAHTLPGQGGAPMHNGQNHFGASFASGGGPSFGTNQPNDRFTSPISATGPSFSALPPPGYATMPNSAAKDAESYHQAASSMDSMGNPGTAAARMNSVSEGALMDSSSQQNAMPIFGVEGYSRSPFVLPDDFTEWLFNTESNPVPGTSPISMMHGAGVRPPLGQGGAGFQGTIFNYNDSGLSNPAYFAQPVPPQHTMTVHSILDASARETALSEEKRQRLLEIIQMRFHETSHTVIKKQKEELLDSANDGSHGVLSLNMLQTYIGVFWMRFHPQMPILHKPTFNADHTPDLLLLAVIALGATCLDKGDYGEHLTNQSSDLSNFLAWHLRFEIFRETEFGPPAKLWIFQSLLLLEVYEKMYSTRRLHERAHIHHATTLTLMRRGSSLIGRSPLDSPPSIKDMKAGAGVATGASGTAGRSGSISAASASGAAHSPDEWWNQWIQAEATRRCAFAAFVVDSIHATMFGHSAIMVAHEMRLPLPCDEALWSATSSAEVGRVEQNLHANGIKPTTFLEGLKKTLNGHNVRTNPFGRTILMAGLLSVSYHMNQRDLSVSYLGVTNPLGGREKWKGALIRAFDHWRADYDTHLSSGSGGIVSGLLGAAASAQGKAPHQRSSSGVQSVSSNSSVVVDDENVFESRTVLHHLAHMAMHVDVVDCQIFAGAPRILGRSVTPQDSNGVMRRMKDDWARSARARDATFYALKFLRKVLLTEETDPRAQSQHDQQSEGGKTASTPTPTPGPTRVYMSSYHARDDFLTNRPWVLYFAALVVWSYGYALDGPLRPAYSLDTEEQRQLDSKGFLMRMTKMATPGDLAQVQNRNACLGLLLQLRDMFRTTKWELLHEASTRLEKCVELLIGA